MFRLSVFGQGRKWYVLPLLYIFSKRLKRAIFQSFKHIWQRAELGNLSVFWACLAKGWSGPSFRLLSMFGKGLKWAIFPSFEHVWPSILCVCTKTAWRARNWRLAEVALFFLIYFAKGGSGPSFGPLSTFWEKTDVVNLFAFWTYLAKIWSGLSQLVLSIFRKVQKWSVFPCFEHFWQCAEVGSLSVFWAYSTEGRNRVSHAWVRNVAAMPNTVWGWRILLKQRIWLKRPCYKRVSCGACVCVWVCVWVSLHLLACDWSGLFVLISWMVLWWGKQHINQLNDNS